MRRLGPAPQPMKRTPCQSWQKWDALKIFVEHGAAVLAPVHVVVARQQQIRFPEVFQNLLQQQELFGVSEFRDVSAEDCEIHGRIGIDVLNSLPQVVFGVGEGIKVYIAKPGEK